MLYHELMTMPEMGHLERLKLAEDTKFDAAFKKAQELVVRTGENHAIISTADSRYHAVPCNNTEAEKTLTALLKIVNGQFHDLVNLK